MLETDKSKDLRQNELRWEGGEPELRVFLRKDCFLNPPPPVSAEEKKTAVGGLAAIFLPKAIEMALGSVATLLKKAGGDHTEVVSGFTTADLCVTNQDGALSPNPDIGCVIGVIGAFGGSGGGKLETPDPILEKLVAAGYIPGSSVVGLAFEAAIRRSADDTAFFLDTRHFSVRRFIGDRRAKERTFVVTFGIATPSNTPEGSTIALGTIVLGKREKGANLVPPNHPLDTFPRYWSNLMPWGQMSDASKAVYEVDVAAKRAQKRKKYGPAMFNLAVSETAEGNKFLLTLGELLESAKQEAATEISKTILPEDRKKAREEQAEAAEKLYEAELEAELRVREAQREYNEGSEEAKPALRVKLEQAKRKLERQRMLREAAGLPAREPVAEK